MTTYYLTAVTDDVPLAYWRLGESSGTTAADSSGNGRAATYVNSPTLGVAGLVDDANTAAEFNGSNTHVQVADAAWLDVTAITVEAMVKPDNTTSVRHIVDRDPGTGGSRIFQFRINASRRLELIFWTSGAGPFFATGATNLSVGTTYHVAATFDGTTGQVWLNGVSDGSGSATGTLKAGTSAVRIGASVDPGGGASTFDGVIDEVAFYDYALSGARLLVHYDASRGIGTGGPIDLAAADSVHAHASDSPALTQAHVVVAADSAHGHTSDAPALTQVHTLAPVDSVHAHAVDSPNLAQTHVLTPADAGHSHGSESPTLTQGQTIQPADSVHGSTSESPTLTQAHELAPADCTHAHTTETPTVAQVHALAPADTLHAHVADSPLVFIPSGLPPPVERTVVTPPEVRILAVAAETRIITTPAETRIITD